ncbi:MAG: MFS transporter, partial [Gemmataceae bacterium]|nr:MFS transporter [Gemmataceae bacterium]
VSAGIGVIGMASPMLQEVFAGRLLGLEKEFDNLSKEELGKIAAYAAGFTGLLSLFNIGGRFFWASLSDIIGRKATYHIFFILGFILYALVPYAGKIGSIAAFALIFCVILTMYGGAFATIPAYLADMFGTKMVGAIHGRLLTAWSAAGILGPVLVNYINESQIQSGIPKSHAYDTTMYILSSLLLGGMVCNFLLKPVNAKWFLIESPAMQSGTNATPKPSNISAIPNETTPNKNEWLLLGSFWLLVGLPVVWGLWKTLNQSMFIFKS